MQIAVIVPSLRNLAPVQVAQSIAGQLMRRGHEITIYYFSSRIELPLLEGIRYEKISFWKSIDWIKYDIIHSHGALPDTYVSFRKSMHSNAKTVSTLHNYVFPELTMLYNSVVSWSFGTTWLIAWTGMDHLVVLTDDALKYYKFIFRKKKISRIYNGRNITPDPKEIIPAHKKVMDDMRNQHGYSIGVCSALISRKRVDILIRHLSRVETGCLFVFGEGPERKNLEKLVNKYGLRDRVKFLGFIPDAYNYFDQFDIFAHPSSTEGFSLSLIEAALCKKKIVCSDIPSFKEAFTETEVTFFDSDNELSIDQAIREALQDQEKADRAYVKASTLYTEERMATEYEALFNSLMKEK